MQHALLVRRLEEDEEALAAAREQLRRLQQQHTDDVHRLENEKRKHAEDTHKASQVLRCIARHARFIGPLLSSISHLHVLCCTALCLTLSSYASSGLL